MANAPGEQEDRRWAQPLTGRLPQGADAAQIAAANVAVWHDIDRALNPVIGPKGVAALRHRSLDGLHGGRPTRKPAADRTP